MLRDGYRYSTPSFKTPSGASLVSAGRKLMTPLYQTGDYLSPELEMTISKPSAVRLSLNSVDFIVYGVGEHKVVVSNEDFQQSANMMKDMFSQQNKQVELVTEVVGGGEGEVLVDDDNTDSR